MAVETLQIAIDLIPFSLSGSNVRAHARARKMIDHRAMLLARRGGARC